METQHNDSDVASKQATIDLLIENHKVEKLALQRAISEANLQKYELEKRICNLEAQLQESRGSSAVTHSADAGVKTSVPKAVSDSPPGTRDADITVQPNPAAERLNSSRRASDIAGTSLSDSKWAIEPLTAPLKHKKSPKKPKKGKKLTPVSPTSAPVRGTVYDQSNTWLLGHRFPNPNASSFVPSRLRQSESASQETAGESNKEDEQQEVNQEIVEVDAKKEMKKEDNKDEYEEDEK